MKRIDLKKIELRIVNPFSRTSFWGFWFEVTYCAKWFTVGDCIGVVNDKQICDLKAVTFRFSVFVLEYRFKNTYAFYY